MDWNGLRVHFIGIGGSGMSGIARIVAARGGKVSGSDYHDSSILNSLRTIGIEVSTEHDAKNIASLRPGTDIVVRSSAVAENNVEIVAA
ncbi:MAG: UDP-N-acetylmuramate--L-alanine ligase, partial [Actinobacteria bacterium]|nr:UDP-N-acetylmuramate--L-alanine ligase [Actinomycetota bacterium]